jgi:hypothetical protein
MTVIQAYAHSLGKILPLPLQASASPDAQYVQETGKNVRDIRSGRAGQLIIGNSLIRAGFFVESSHHSRH